MLAFHRTRRSFNTIRALGQSAGPRSKRDRRSVARAPGSKRYPRSATLGSDVELQLTPVVQASISHPCTRSTSAIRPSKVFPLLIALADPGSRDTIRSVDQPAFGPPRAQEQQHATIRDPQRPQGRRNDRHRPASVTATTCTSGQVHDRAGAWAHRIRIGGALVRRHARLPARPVLAVRLGERGRARTEHLEHWQRKCTVRTALDRPNRRRCPIPSARVGSSTIARSNGMHAVGARALR